MQAHRGLLLAGLMVLSALAIMPAPVQADPPGAGDWLIQPVTGLNGEDTNRLYIDGHSGKVGIAFQRTTSNDLGFAIGDWETGFAVQTLDISSGDAVINNPQLAKVSDTTWVIYGTTTSLIFKVWRSTNSGSTWTEVYTHTTTTTGPATARMARDQSDTDAFDTLWLAYQDSTSGGTINYNIDKSSDGGATWATVRSFGVVSGGNINIWAQDSSNVCAFMVGLGYTCSDDGGSFWNSIAGSGGPYPLAGLTSYRGAQPVLAGANAGTLYLTNPATRASSADQSVLTVTGQQALTGCQADVSPNGQIGLVNPGNAAGFAIYYSGSYGSSVSLIRSGADDDQTACIAMQNSRAYMAFSNSTFGGRLEVWSAELPESLLSPVWCSDFTARNYGGDPDADFGYNYAENVIDFDSGADINDGYRFEATSGDTSDLAYLGKGWATPGTDYAKVTFRIEAQGEGRDTYFRPVFSFDTDTPSSTSRGNGLDTGSFEDHIEAVFHEDGSRWQVNIHYSNAGSTRAQVGTTVNWPVNPNDPHTFSMTVNTQGAGYVLIRDEDNDQVIKNQTLAFTGSPAGFAVYSGNDPMFSQWFVSSGSNAVLSSITFLDDNDVDETSSSNDSSTCIRFDDNTLSPGGVTIEGDPGTEDPADLNFTGTGSSTSSCTNVLCVNADNVPDGFTAATFNFFLGLLLMIAVAMGVWFLTHSPLITMGGFVAGYLIALAFSLVPLWPIIILAVIALGVVFVRFKSPG